MTVKELINYLSQENPDLEVLVDGYEEGFDPIANIEHKYVQPHSDPKSYHGEFEESNQPSYQKALIFSRFKQYVP